MSLNLPYAQNIFISTNFSHFCRKDEVANFKSSYFIFTYVYVIIEASQ